MAQKSLGLQSGGDTGEGFGIAESEEVETRVVANVGNALARTKGQALYVTDFNMAVLGRD